MSFGSQDPFTNEVNPYAAPTTTSSSPPSHLDIGSAPLAGRMNRLGARIIDGIINLVISLPVMYATGYITRVQTQQVSFVELAGWTVFGLATYLLVNGYLLATRGQTVGKMLAKIRIVDYQTNQLLSLPKLVGLRDLPMGVVAVIPKIGPLLNIVNVLFIFGSDRRCIHDLIAGTKVVDVQ